MTTLRFTIVAFILILQVASMVKHEPLVLKDCDVQGVQGKAKCGASVVDVVHRDRGGVEFQIGFGFELGAALADVFEWKEVAEIRL